MTKYCRVKQISTLTFLLASTVLIIIISSDLSTRSFGQSDVQINKLPMIAVTSPIEGEVNQTVIINASISDPDG
ncbi:MAG: hypothetical protein ABR515_08660, partial [Nitrososphaeraceae archaeon]